MKIWITYPVFSVHCTYVLWLSITRARTLSSTLQLHALPALSQATPPYKVHPQIAGEQVSHTECLHTCIHGVGTYTPILGKKACTVTQPLISFCGSSCPATSCTSTATLATHTGTDTRRYSLRSSMFCLRQINKLCFERSHRSL